MALLKLYWISDKGYVSWNQPIWCRVTEMKYCYQVVLQTAVSKLVLHIDTTFNSSHGGERTRFSWCSAFPNSQLVVFISWKQYNPPTVSISTRGHVKIVFQSWNQIKWMYVSVWENVPFLENSFLLFLSWRLLSCNFCNIYIDGFHGDVIRLQSQKSEVLRILIYTRLKINRK